MKIILSVIALFILSCNFLISQNLLSNFKVNYYLLKDSTENKIVKEVTRSDGTKVYNFIPKSSLSSDVRISSENIPTPVFEWFNNQKAAPVIERERPNAPISRRRGQIDSSSISADKKKNTILWILGTSAVLGGVTAYYFLGIKKKLDELPTQPEPPR